MSRPSTIEIELSELRGWFTCLCDHLEFQVGEKVTVPHELYWTVIGPQRTDPYIQPEPTLGDLGWDVDNVKDMVDGKRGDPVSYGLVWLGSILHTIGAHVFR